MGLPGEPVLLTDLSDVTTIAQATSIFQDWARDIESNPELWADSTGWSIEKLRTTLRLWADRYGESILQLIRP